jgi:Beta/Gamma crystallin
VPNIGGRFNHQISSVKIYGNAEVTVFENENFGGARRTFTRDAANLQDLGWNDMITSFQVSGVNIHANICIRRFDPDKPRWNLCAQQCVNIQ